MRYQDKTFWLFVTHEDHEFHTDILGRKFENEWLKVSPDGRMKIKGSHVLPSGKSGYAWDGCSPKFAVLDIVIGTPDGVTDHITEKPKTYYASMVHDALYQFGYQARIKRGEIDKLFHTMLKGFRLRHLYFGIIWLLGWLGYKKG